MEAGLIMSLFPHVSVINELFYMSAHGTLLTGWGGQQEVTIHIYRKKNNDNIRLTFAYMTPCLSKWRHQEMSNVEMS